MTTYFLDDISVIRSKHLFRVRFEDGEYAVYIQAEPVEEICKVFRGDENLVAILLASIELTRRLNVETNGDGTFVPKGITEKQIVEVCIKLLVSECCFFEELLLIVREMKYHDIVQLFSAENPVRMLMEQFS